MEYKQDEKTEIYSRRNRINELKRKRQDRRNKRLMKRLVAFSTVIIFAAIITIVAMVVKTNNTSNDIVLENNMVTATIVPTVTPIEEEAVDIPETEAPTEKSTLPTQPVVVTNGETKSTDTYVPSGSKKGKIIVLDAGHGISSSKMSESDKKAEGYKQNNGKWGEWRHFKNGTDQDCCGSGCTGTGPSCWYGISNGDRSTEPQINLNNALAAKKYLESMGYTVRMTRTSASQNPSMTKRLSYCYPNNDSSASPDASLYVSIHSNAGGGRGTGYVALEGSYKQKYIPSDYIATSNSAGKIINSCVASNSTLKDKGAIGGEGYLVLLSKSPVPIAYLEIGFFDNSSDLAILNSKSDAIGKGIAEGVDAYIKSK